MKVKFYHKIGMTGVQGARKSGSSMTLELALLPNAVQLLLPLSVEYQEPDLKKASQKNKKRRFAREKYRAPLSRRADA